MMCIYKEYGFIVGMGHCYKKPSFFQSLVKSCVGLYMGIDSLYTL